MPADIVNIGLAFLEGFALIISPCILPILPIILAGSLTDSKKRPIGIILGFIFTFAIFTFFSRKLVQYTGIDLNLIRYASYGILFFLAIIMLSTYLTEKFSLLTQRLTNTGSTLSAINDPQGGLLSGIDAWINSQPLQLSELKGHVVLIDFWTYSCINCMRTLPYLKDWYEKYHDKGLVIIGVHSPEFDFEKNVDNVKHAVVKDGINYPVALDNQFATWRNFNNSYWPAHYLIDKNGNVVYTHFGEGKYDVTENNIRYLLGLKERTTTHTADANIRSASETPETYLGYARADHFSSPEAVTKDQPTQYTFPKELTSNTWALQGSWAIMPDRVIAYQKNAAIKINFHARKVYIVMGNSTDTPITVKLLLNGENMTRQKGKDVVDSSLRVDKHSLYETIQLDKSDSGILQVIASAPGLEVYTFTFGE